MRGRVGFHRRADIVALAVEDDIHPLFLRIADGFVQRAHTLPTIHFIVSRLGLDRRDNPAQRVNQALVVCENRSRRTLERLAVRRIRFLFEIGRNIIQLGIQPCHRRVLQRGNSFDHLVQRHL